jgi:hypothetical protein
VSFKSFQLLGLMTLAVAALHGQTYWSTSSSLDCTGVEGPIQIATNEYACAVSGTFVWLAAGGEWSTQIRVAAPASNPIGVDYTFYDQSGNALSLDTNLGAGTSTATGNDVNFALQANQPAEVNLLGAGGGSPSYSATETGSVYVIIYCPDATTCLNALPQLIYSALPTTPWSLSVPIAWDDNLSQDWSAEGIDDGGKNLVSFVIYNEDTVPNTYAIYVYDSAGNQVAAALSPSIPGANSSTGQSGTYAALLRDTIPDLPSGIFKILVDGSSSTSTSSCAGCSAVEVLQFTGQSGTSLQVGFDTPPNSLNAANRLAAHPGKSRRQRTLPKPQGNFPPLKK